MKKFLSAVIFSLIAMTSDSQAAMLSPEHRSVHIVNETTSLLPRLRMKVIVLTEDGVKLHGSIVLENIVPGQTLEIGDLLNAQFQKGKTLSELLAGKDIKDILVSKIKVYQINPDSTHQEIGWSKFTKPGIKNTLYTIQSIAPKTDHKMRRHGVALATPQEVTLVCEAVAR